MKKLLLSIFWLLFWLISFCSADLVQCADEDWCPVDFSSCVNSITIVLSWDYSDPLYIYPYQDEYSVYTEIESYSNTPITLDEYSCWFYIYNNKWSTINVNWSEYVAPVPEITVFYDYWHSSTTITCNWDNSIFINSMAVNSWVTFTPFFNINYIDQDNQIITESYNKDLLYLTDWKFHKSYTWENLWVLSVVSDSESSFSGYLPTFDVTWNITQLDTWNVFNNFAENSLGVLLSNVPNYIQYVIMFMLLLFVLWIFRKLR